MLAYWQRSSILQFFGNLSFFLKKITIPYYSVRKAIVMFQKPSSNLFFMKLDFFLFLKLGKYKAYKRATTQREWSPRQIIQPRQS